MPWHDKNIVEEMDNIRKQFGFTHLVETGTDEGIGARFWSKRFDEVYTCETRERRFELAGKNVVQCNNVHRFLESSVTFVPRMRQDLSAKGTVYMLDAHNYGKWPLFDEIRSLKNTLNCAIVIHDFRIKTEPHLRFDVYKVRADKESPKRRRTAATLKLLKGKLLAINPDFVFYHNTIKHAQIYSADEILNTDLFFDEHTKSRDRYDWSQNVKHRTGVLFAVPGELSDTTLLKYD